MNNLNSVLTSVQASLPSTYSIYKRIANLILAVIGLLICINLWILSTDQAQNWHEKQANQLGRSLSKQGALVISDYMANKDNEAISRQLEFILSDKHVSGVTLFDQQGQIVDSTFASYSVLGIMALSEEIPLIFVEEVIHDGDIFGYLRLTLNEKQVMQYHDEYQQQLYKQIQVLMLLAFVVGLLSTRAFYKFRIRYWEHRNSLDTSNQ